MLLFVLQSLLGVGALLPCLWLAKRGFVWLRHQIQHTTERECWCCSQTLVLQNKSATTGWICPGCDSYNGFDEGGDYNKGFVEHYSASIQKMASAVKQFVQNSAQSSRTTLCQACRENQEIVVQKLKDFEPSCEEKFDDELQYFQDELDETYKLCADCIDNVHRGIERANDKVTNDGLNRLYGGHYHQTFGQKCDLWGRRISENFTQKVCGRVKDYVLNNSYLVIDFAILIIQITLVSMMVVSALHSTCFVKQNECSQYPAEDFYPTTTEATILDSELKCTESDTCDFSESTKPTLYRRVPTVCKVCKFFTPQEEEFYAEVLGNEDILIFCAFLAFEATRMILRHSLGVQEMGPINPYFPPFRFSIQLVVYWLIFAVLPADMTILHLVSTRVQQVNFNGHMEYDIWEMISMCLRVTAMVLQLWRFWSSWHHNFEYAPPTPFDDISMPRKTPRQRSEKPRQVGAFPRVHEQDGPAENVEKQEAPPRIVTSSRDERTSSSTQSPAADCCPLTPTTTSSSFIASFDRVIKPPSAYSPDVSEGDSSSEEDTPLASKSKSMFGGSSPSSSSYSGPGPGSMANVMASVFPFQTDSRKTWAMHHRTAQPSESIQNEESEEGEPCFTEDLVAPSRFPAQISQFMKRKIADPVVGSTRYQESFWSLFRRGKLHELFSSHGHIMEHVNCLLVLIGCYTLQLVFPYVITVLAYLGVLLALLWNRVNFELRRFCIHSQQEGRIHHPFPNIFQSLTIESIVYTFVYICLIIRVSQSLETDYHFLDVYAVPIFNELWSTLKKHGVELVLLTFIAFGSLFIRSDRQ